MSYARWPKKIGQRPWALSAKAAYEHTQYPSCVDELRDIRVVWTRPGKADAAAWTQELTRWAALLATDRGGGHHVLKREPAAETSRIDGVYRATLTVDGEERQVVIKCRVLRRLGDQLKARLTMGRADRHRRGAASLAEHGIDTAAVLTQAYGRVDDTTARRSCPVELLVMEYIEGRTLLEVMAAIAEERDDAPSVKEQHELARAIGRQLYQLQINTLRNRDHKPSNLIVCKDDSEKWRVVVIDTVAIRQGSTARITRTLAALTIEPIGCSCLPRRTLRMRTLKAYADAFGKPFSREYIKWSVYGIWSRVHRLIERHGDSRPKINPLGTREIV